MGLFGFDIMIVKRKLIKKKRFYSTLVDIRKFQKKKKKKVSGLARFGYSI
jgi:DeoR/GlpR family transcriptional regulator of sugar metabolism